MSAKKIASPRRFLATIALVVVAPTSCLAAQTATPSAGQPVVVAAGARAAASATRAARAPSIDGRDDDAAWRDATPITGFRQFDPVEDAESSMRTEARVAYDDAQPLRLRSRVRSAAGQHRRPAVPARREDRVGPDQGHDRLVSRQAQRLRVRRQPGRREARLLHLRRRARRRVLGRRVGRRHEASTRSAGRPSSASRSSSCAIRRGASAHVRR